MKEFERFPTKGRVKTDADQTKKLFVADLTKRMHVSGALRLYGVKVTQDIAKVTWTATRTWWIFPS